MTTTRTRARLYPMTRATITVDVVSDIVCPWCWIGTTRLRRAAATVSQRHSVEVAIRWKAFQLDPTAPRTPEPVAVAYAKKFGSEEAATRIIDQVTEVARADGLDMRLDRAQRANTLDGHRLIAWVDEQERAGRAPSGTTDRVAETLFRNYFHDGLDIADHDTLVDAARDAGLDAEATATYLDSDDGIDHVRQQLAEAHERGISSVPTTVVPSGWAVPGAQDVETFVRLLERALPNLSPDPS